MGTVERYAAGVILETRSVADDFRVRILEAYVAAQEDRSGQRVVSSGIGPGELVLPTQKNAAGQGGGWIFAERCFESASLQLN